MGCVASNRANEDKRDMQEPMEDKKDMNEPIEDKRDMINDLPDEMLVEIFQYLNIHEIAFRYTEICIHWRENIALHILAPEIKRQAKANPSFKKLLEKNQWTEECKDVEMLIYIYNKTINRITSEFIFLARSCSNNI